MDPRTGALRRTFPRFILGGLVTGGLFFAYDSIAVPDLPNYSLNWDPPKGWEEVPHSLVSIFRYENPVTKAHITGSVQQIDPDSPVRQEYDTNGLAEEALKNAVSAQLEWRTRRLADLRARDETFSLIQKEQPGKSIVHAYCVKGGSIMLFTLSCPGPISDRDMSDFVAFLKGVRLKEAEKRTTPSELRRRSQPRESP